MWFYLGYNSQSNGHYALGGGSLGTSEEFVGEGGIGVFTQSGGTNNGTYVYLGFYAGSSGTYNLSRGYLSVPRSLIVGTSGAGTFTQSGGTNQTTALVLAGSAGSWGTYELDGGLLRLSASAGEQALRHST